MSAWLGSPAVLYLGFIAIVLGIPASVITIWLFMPAVRRDTPRFARKPAVLSADAVPPTPLRIAGGVHSTDGPAASYASRFVANSNGGAQTITFTPEPKWYVAGLSQSGEGGFPVYPGGL